MVINDVDKPQSHKSGRRSLNQLIIEIKDELLSMAKL